MTAPDRSSASPPPPTIPPAVAAEIIAALSAAVRAQIAIADSVLLSGTAEALRLLADECDLAVDRRAEGFARAVQTATEGPPPPGGGAERFVSAEDLPAALGLPAPRVQRHIEEEVLLSTPDGLYPVEFSRRRVAFVEIQPVDEVVRVLDEACALLTLCTRLRLHIGQGTPEERLARLRLYFDVLGAFEDTARLHAATHRGPEGILATALASNAIQACADAGVEAEGLALRELLGDEPVEAALMEASGAELALLMDFDPLVAPGLARVLRNRAEGLIGPKLN